MEQQVEDNTTILIVDDSPEDIKALSGLLRSYRKKAALNGRDAMKISLSGKQPDLILLDVLMPGQSGYEVCEELRSHDLTKEIPIIFISAKSEKEDVLRGFEAGGQDYITKPFDARELLERINTQLQLKSQKAAIKTMNDILEQRVKERTAQLEEANKELMVLSEAKNNFLLMVSHEMRTPLNGIVQATRLMSDLVIDNELQEYMDLLKISVDRLDRFAITALTITQLQSGVNRLDFNNITIVQLFDTCVNRLIETATNKNIRVQKNIKSNSKLWVDEELINRVLVSVLENAIRFAPAESTIVISSYLHKNNCIVEVVDSGPGFSQVALDNLFKPFSYHETHTDDSLGLSLRAAQLIMKAHNSLIEIRNLEDRGAMVRLSFNLDRESSK